jgi:HEPN domain-containing protein
MGNREEGLRWLDQAEADLKTARDCLEDANYYASAFFAQQAAEKALKGILYWQGYRALVTHSVLELLEECSNVSAEFGTLLDAGRELDRHYIGARYPDFYPAGAPHKYYTKETASQCVSYAGSILEHARRYTSA